MNFSLDEIPDHEPSELESHEAVAQPAPVTAPVAALETPANPAPSIADKVPPPAHIFETVKDNSCAPIWNVLREYVAPLVKPVKDAEAAFKAKRESFCEQGLYPGSAYHLIAKHNRAIGASNDPTEIVALSKEVARLQALHPSIAGLNVNPRAVLTPGELNGARLLNIEFYNIVAPWNALIGAAEEKLSELESNFIAAEQNLFAQFGFTKREPTGLVAKIHKVRAALEAHGQTMASVLERTYIPGNVAVFEAVLPELGL